MNKIKFGIIIFVILFFEINYSQFINTDFNKFQKFPGYKWIEYTNYLISDNPAWLARNYKADIISVNKLFSTHYGKLRKKFSPERIHKFISSASTLRNLKKSGVFYGKFNYTYELRKNNNQILTKRTYTGNPFFLRDNTKGNFKYKGPGIILGYSVNVNKKLSAGIIINYSVHSGLKETYTYAESTSREILINPGVAYRVNNDINFGIAYKYYSFQENISIQDVNNLSVEIFRHRGDNVFVRTISSKEEEKDKTDENVISFFSSVKLSNKIDLKFKSDYGKGKTRIIVPQSLLIDNEYGKEVYNVLNLNFLASAKLNKKIKVDLGYSLYSKKSRSQNSQKNYLLWNWSNISHTMGIRISYKKNNKFRMGIEAGLIKVITDSSKYIDSKLSKKNSSDFYSGLFGNFVTGEKSEIQFQFGYQKKEKDLYLGVEDLKELKSFIAFNYILTKTITVKPFMVYRINKAFKNNELLMFGIKLLIN